MVSGVGSLRSKRTPLDEYNAMRRRSTSGVLKTTLPVPSAVTTTAVSPAVSEKSWTPLSNVAALDDVTQSSALTHPVSLIATFFKAMVLISTSFPMRIIPHGSKPGSGL
ncbi:hypothetical protein NECAME_12109 [Necator americanus]|uniref:Uncharacterized protein n=1 Tax=Necator americanus TaxID=51031 RepID=W2T1D9_NECAM|nr:hypothetical protein NECAME_12109 [Necator americanus]ETN75800.1 hypothetical protein NECAME_12109 [Necator americanus]